jgi:hypothetical protein
MGGGAIATDFVDEGATATMPTRRADADHDHDAADRRKHR